MPTIEGPIGLRQSLVSARFSQAGRRGGLFVALFRSDSVHLGLLDGIGVSYQRWPVKEILADGGRRADSPEAVRIAAPERRTEAGRE